MQLLSEKVGFKYRVHLVRDGKYGSTNSDGSWNGMIGELLRDVGIRYVVLEWCVVDGASGRGPADHQSTA